MSIYQTLRSTGLPVAYGFFKQPQELPYLCYIQSGQKTLPADDTLYHTEPDYQIEYYFKDKDIEMEELIEQTLLDDGYIFDKSGDSYISDDRVFVIYYNV